MSSVQLLPAPQKRQRESVAFFRYFFDSLSDHLEVLLQHDLRIHQGDLLEEKDLVAAGEIDLLLVFSLAPPAVEADGVVLKGDLRLDAGAVLSYLSLPQGNFRL